MLAGMGHERLPFGLKHKHYKRLKRLARDVINFRQIFNIGPSGIILKASNGSFRFRNYFRKMWHTAVGITAVTSLGTKRCLIFLLQWSLSFLHFQISVPSMGLNAASAFSKEIIHTNFKVIH
jgi:hypothetical protein